MHSSFFINLTYIIHKAFILLNPIWWQWDYFKSKLKCSSFLGNHSKGFYHNLHSRWHNKIIQVIYIYSLWTHDIDKHVFKLNLEKKNGAFQFGSETHNNRWMYIRGYVLPSLGTAAAVGGAVLTNTIVSIIML